LAAAKPKKDDGVISVIGVGLDVCFSLPIILLGTLGGAIIGGMAVTAVVG